MHLRQPPGHVVRLARRDRRDRRCLCVDVLGALTLFFPIWDHAILCGRAAWVVHILGALFLAAVLRHAHFALLGILTLGALVVFNALCLTHSVGLRLAPDRSTFRLGGSGGMGSATCGVGPCSFDSWAEANPVPAISAIVARPANNTLCLFFIPIVSSGSCIPYCDAKAGSPRKFRFHVIFCQRNCALRGGNL